MSNWVFTSNIFYENLITTLCRKFSGALAYMYMHEAPGAITAKSQI